MVGNDRFYTCCKVSTPGFAEFMRLLPNNSQINWVPYLCLAPVLLVPIDTYLGKASSADWVATAALMAAFLPLYFWSFWLRGWRAALPIGGMAALGFLAIPFNSSASIFILYASAVIGFLGNAKRSVAALAIMIIAVALQSRLLGYGIGYWAPTVVLIVVFGGFCINWTETDRTNAKLRMKQEEIERLAKIAERERIARDLHDLLGHTLSLNVLKARLANKLINKDVEKASQEISDIEQISRDALQEVREAVQGYRTVGLAGELENARLALEAADITGDYSTAEMTLEPTHDSIFAMTLREAITNVIRHSGAKRCHIKLSQSDSVIELKVDDDGRGGRFVEGSGLSGMRERLVANGGVLHIDSSDGMKVAASLPAASSRQSPQLSLIKTASAP
jgi:two-component system, NarL family, sensor histidine kinase DesK